MGPVSWWTKNLNAVCDPVVIVSVLCSRGDRRLYPILALDTAKRAGKCGSVCRILRITTVEEDVAALHDQAHNPDNAHQRECNNDKSLAPFRALGKVKHH